MKVYCATGQVFQLPRPSRSCKISLPLFPLSNGVSGLSHAEQVLTSDDADPIIKEHSVFWLLCIESYNVSRLHSVEGWVHVYGDLETCIYQNDCDVIIAFRGTYAVNDIYDDLLLSFGAVYPRISRALRYVVELKRLNPLLKIHLTGHSLGGAIARDVGKVTGSPVVTFNAAAPPSMPVDTGIEEIDYHVVFDFISAWQYPNTVRIDKGWRPEPKLWRYIVPFTWLWRLFDSILPAHGLDNFSNLRRGVVVDASLESGYMQEWFWSLPRVVRQYVLVLLFSSQGRYMSSLPDLQ